MTQIDTTVHMPPPYNENEVSANNPEAHMPPQPKPAATTVQGWEWNAETNEWAPSNEPVGGGSAELGNQEPGHGNVSPANPMVDQPQFYGGMPGQGGSVPDARGNLLDAVRQPSESTPLPTQRVEHVITTMESGTDLVRTRTIRLDGTGPVVILEENPYRTRALLKMVTSNAVAMLYPLRQGGGGASTAGVPTAPNAGYLIATGDPVHETKSQAGLEGIVQDTGSVVYADITIWEEMSVPGDKPGIGI